MILPPIVTNETPGLIQGSNRWSLQYLYCCCPYNIATVMVSLCLPSDGVHCTAEFTTGMIFLVSCVFSDRSCHLEDDTDTSSCG